MNIRSTYFILICIFAGLLFIITNEYLRGYMRSPENLAKEVKSPVDSIYVYKIASQAPFKYRLLFPAVMKNTYEAAYDSPSPSGFYHIYRFWSWFFYIASAAAMFYLLNRVGFPLKYCLAGTFTFLLLPAMLFAFSLPVHTREDTLAYTLLFLGLAFLIDERRVAFLCISLLGVLTRETLLLLPLLYFFFSNDQNWIRRFVFAGHPGILWLSVRLWMGQEKYDFWEGLRWNLENPEQVVGFVFLTFNLCWIPFLLHLIFYRRSQKEKTPQLRFFYRTSLFTLAIILITTFVGGIYNEIRLLYLFSPWIIVIFVDFIWKNMDAIRTAMEARFYWLYALIASGFCAAVLYVISKYSERIIVPGKYNVPYDQWIVITVVYFFLLLLFLPLCIKVLTLKKITK